MNEILLIKGYALGWFWLKKVPLEDWTWLIEIFATMTDNTDTYDYANFNDEDIANKQFPARVESIDTKALSYFLYEDQGYAAGFREYGYYIAARALGIKSEKEYMNRLTDIERICNRL